MSEPRTIFILSEFEDYDNKLILKAFESLESARAAMYEAYGIKPDKILTRRNKDEMELGYFIIEPVELHP